MEDQNTVVLDRNRNYVSCHGPGDSHEVFTKDPFIYIRGEDIGESEVVRYHSCPFPCVFPFM